jgi:hypothetical protein
MRQGKLAAKRQARRQAKKAFAKPQSRQGNAENPGQAGTKLHHKVHKEHKGFLCELCAFVVSKIFAFCAHSTGSSAASQARSLAMIS